LRVQEKGPHCAPVYTLGTGIGFAADQSRSAACDPRNVPPNERADMLHQSRPGGSDCSPQSALQSERDALAKRNRQLQQQQQMNDPHGDRYGSRGYDRNYDSRSGDRYGDTWDRRDSGSYGSSSRNWR